MDTVNDAPNMAHMSDDEIAKEIGVRLRAERIRKQLTQLQMAERAGIPLRTYKRLETNGTGAIATLIAAMRACDRILGLQIMLPQPALPEKKNALIEVTKRRASQKWSRRG